MKFGPVPVGDALGAILAHSMPLQKGRLRKGVVLGADHIAELAAAGHDEVTVARLGPDDLGEDAAAAQLAAAMVAGIDAPLLRLGRATTGRVNLHATAAGVLDLDVAAISAANRVDPMITIATLPPFARVSDGAIVATIKVISYGVARGSVQRAVDLLHGAMRVRPVVMRSATLIETTIGDAAPGKGEAAIRERLERMGITLDTVTHVPHRTGPLADAVARAQGDLILILTASATSDPHDTAPEAVRIAGGSIARFGMPVDPGNLLFIGQSGDVPVIGLPGCARSIALNGADWVLERVVCGIPVEDGDIAAMGVGGLLKDIPQRGRRRESANPDGKG